MEITGIICEYNPFHLGHMKQFTMIRDESPDCAIVCLMSGNYVQRGMPAIFDKVIRAKTAMECGADLVLELPVAAALSSAESFAAEGVRILGGFCDNLSFGAETPNIEILLQTAHGLLTDDFSAYLKEDLSTGVSFPAARQKALASMGLECSFLDSPNNILAIEYCKAILSQNSHMKAKPILRQGNYHEVIPDSENPSATSVRRLLETDKRIDRFIPECAIKNYQNASVHTLASAEHAILYRLRTMTNEEYEALPFGSEGLWRKLMKNARNLSTLEEILVATKSKRYTRTRLDRMVMCAFLGLTEQEMNAPVPYTRVLALNDKGREVLLKARQTGDFLNIGEKQNHPYQQLENRCDDLYGLFVSSPEKSGITSNRRIIYQRTDIA